MEVYCQIRGGNSLSRRRGEVNPPLGVKTLYMAGRVPCHVATENVNTVWKNIWWCSYPVAALR
jgi:hypothetical protein